MPPNINQQMRQILPPFLPLSVSKNLTTDTAWRQKIVGTETVDHPTDNQLVAHARKYFRTADRMRLQRG
jgi:hypothetical protein